MKIKNLILACSAGLLLVTSCNQTPKVENVNLSNQVDSISYALGLINAEGIKQQLKGPFDTVDVKKVAAVYAISDFNEQMKNGMKQSFDTINFKLMKTGLMNGLVQDKDKYFASVQDINAYLQTSYQAIRTAKMNKPGSKAYENKQASEKFLSENAKKEGVKTTASGLQYQVIKEGKGKKPTAKDKVKVHYHGTLPDGTVFDSSVDRGTPATFGVSQVIPGWTEGLQLMTVGSKYKFFIPSNLAYGINGSGPKIGPNQALVFEVELLKIEK